MANFLLNDFSKGFSSDSIQNDPSYAEELKNLNLNNSNKLVQRPGSRLLTDKSIPGTGPIRFVREINGIIFVERDGQLYNFDSPPQEYGYPEFSDDNKYLFLDAASRASFYDESTRLIFRKIQGLGSQDSIKFENKQARLNGARFIPDVWNSFSAGKSEISIGFYINVLDQVNGMQVLKMFLGSDTLPFLDLSFKRQTSTDTAGPFATSLDVSVKPSVVGDAPTVTLLSQDIMSEDEKYHIGLSVSLSDKKAKLYINGKKVAEENIVADSYDVFENQLTTYADTVRWGIGDCTSSSLSLSAHSFVIQDVSLFSKALSDEEFKVLFNFGTILDIKNSSISDNLSHWWRLTTQPDSVTDGTNLSGQDFVPDQVTGDTSGFSTYNEVSSNASFFGAQIVPDFASSRNEKSLKIVRNDVSSQGNFVDFSSIIPEMSSWNDLSLFFKVKIDTLAEGTIKLLDIHGTDVNENSLPFPFLKMDITRTGNIFRILGSVSPDGYHSQDFTIGPGINENTDTTGISASIRNGWFEVSFALSLLSSSGGGQSAPFIYRVNAHSFNRSNIAALPVPETFNLGKSGTARLGILEGSSISTILIDDLRIMNKFFQRDNTNYPDYKTIHNSGCTSDLRAFSEIDPSFKHWYRFGDETLDPQQGRVIAGSSFRDSIGRSDLIFLSGDIDDSYGEVVLDTQCPSEGTDLVRIPGISISPGTGTTIGPGGVVSDPSDTAVQVTRRVIGPDNKLAVSYPLENSICGFATRGLIDYTENKFSYGFQLKVESISEARSHETDAKSLVVCVGGENCYEPFRNDERVVQVNVINSSTDISQPRLNIQLDMDLRTASGDSVKYTQQTGELGGEGLISLNVWHDIVVQYDVESDLGSISIDGSQEVSFSVGKLHGIISGFTEHGNFGYFGNLPQDPFERDPSLPDLVEANVLIQGADNKFGLKIPHFIQFQTAFPKNIRDDGTFYPGYSIATSWYINQSECIVRPAGSDTVLKVGNDDGSGIAAKHIISGHQIGDGSTNHIPNSALGFAFVSIFYIADPNDTEKIKFLPVINRSNENRGHFIYRGNNSTASAVWPRDDNDISDILSHGKTYDVKNVYDLVLSVDMFLKRIHLYVNGQLDQTWDTSNIFASSVNSFIGLNENHSIHLSNGFRNCERFGISVYPEYKMRNRFYVFDNVQAYSKALSQSEANLLHNEGVSVNPRVLRTNSSLIGYVDFDTIVNEYLKQFPSSLVFGDGNATLISLYKYLEIIGGDDTSETFNLYNEAYWPDNTLRNIRFVASKEYIKPSQAIARRMVKPPISTIEYKRLENYQDNLSYINATETSSSRASSPRIWDIAGHLDIDNEFSYSFYFNTPNDPRTGPDSDSRSGGGFVPSQPDSMLFGISQDNSASTNPWTSWSNSVSLFNLAQTYSPGGRWGLAAWFNFWGTSTSNPFNSNLRIVQTPDAFEYGKWYHITCSVKLDPNKENSFINISVHDVETKLKKDWWGVFSGQDMITSLQSPGDGDHRVFWFFSEGNSAYNRGGLQDGFSKYFSNIYISKKALSEDRVRQPSDPAVVLDDSPQIEFLSFIGDLKLYGSDQSPDIELENVLFFHGKIPTISSRNLKSQFNYRMLTNDQYNPATWLSIDTRRVLSQSSLQVGTTDQDNAEGESVIQQGDGNLFGTLHPPLHTLLGRTTTQTAQGRLQVTASEQTTMTSKMDNFRYYKDVLTSDEVTTAYNHGVPINYVSGPKAGNLENYYRFGDAFGDPERGTLVAGDELRNDSGKNAITRTINSALTNTKGLKLKGATSGIYFPVLHDAKKPEGCHIIHLNKKSVAASNIILDGEAISGQKVNVFFETPDVKIANENSFTGAFATRYHRSHHHLFTVKDPFDPSRFRVGFRCVFLDASEDWPDDGDAPNITEVTSISLETGKMHQICFSFKYDGDDPKILLVINGIVNEYPVPSGYDISTYRASLGKMNPDQFFAVGQQLHPVHQATGPSEESYIDEYLSFSNFLDREELESIYNDGVLFDFVDDLSETPAHYHRFDNDSTGNKANEFEFSNDNPAVSVDSYYAYNWASIPEDDAISVVEDEEARYPVQKQIQVGSADAIAFGEPTFQALLQDDTPPRSKLITVDYEQEEVEIRPDDPEIIQIDGRDENNALLEQKQRLESSLFSDSDFYQQGSGVSFADSESQFSSELSSVSKFSFGFNFSPQNENTFPSTTNFRPIFNLMGKFTQSDYYYPRVLLCLRKSSDTNADILSLCISDMNATTRWAEHALINANLRAGFSYQIGVSIDLELKTYIVMVNGNKVYSGVFRESTPSTLNFNPAGSEVDVQSFRSAFGLQACQTKPDLTAFTSGGASSEIYQSVYFNRCQTSGKDPYYFDEFYFFKDKSLSEEEWRSVYNDLVVVNPPSGVSYQMTFEEAYEALTDKNLPQSLFDNQAGPVSETALSNISSQGLSMNYFGFRRPVITNESDVQMSLALSRGSRVATGGGIKRNPNSGATNPLTPSSVEQEREFDGFKRISPSTNSLRNYYENVSDELWSSVEQDDNILVSNKQIPPYRLFLNHSDEVNKNFEYSSLGVRPLDKTPEFSIEAQSGDKSYVYAIAICSTRNQASFDLSIPGARKHRVLSTPVFLEASDIPEIAENSQVTLSNLSPNYFLSTTDEFINNKNLTICVYRTINAGEDFYKIAETKSDTYIDQKTDADILDLEPAPFSLTNASDFRIPPRARHVTVYNNVTIFGNYRDYESLSSGELTDYPNSARFSLPGHPDYSPATFRLDFPEEIRGQAAFGRLTSLSFQGFAVFLCTNKVFLVDGIFTQDGRFPTMRAVHQTAGCISANSIVQAEDAIYWLGNDGVYMIDSRGTVKKISKHINDYYLRCIQRTHPRVLQKTSGTYDREQRRIYWNLSENGLSDECLYVNLRTSTSEAGAFFQYTNVPSNQLMFWEHGQSLLRFDDETGSVFRHFPNVLNDLIKDSTRSFGDWKRSIVPAKIKLPIIDFGASNQEKWVYYYTVEPINMGRAVMQPKIFKDGRPHSVDLTQIDSLSNWHWGDKNLIWGVSDFVFGQGGLKTFKRKTPSRYFRSFRTQFELEPARITLASSSIYGKAQVHSDLGFIQVRGYNFPLPVETYALEIEQFENTLFRVLSVDGDKLYFDAADASVLSTLESSWKIVGFDINSVFSLSSIGMLYRLITPPAAGLTPPGAPSSGAGAGVSGG